MTMILITHCYGNDSDRPHPRPLHGSIHRNRQMAPMYTHHFMHDSSGPLESTLSNAQFTPPARHDTTVVSVSCLVCRCELDDCSERVQTSDFLSATVLSFRESNSYRRRRQDSLVVSCVVV